MLFTTTLTSSFLIHSSTVSVSSTVFPIVWLSPFFSLFFFVYETCVQSRTPNRRLFCIYFSTHMFFFCMPTGELTCIYYTLVGNTIKVNLFVVFAIYLFFVLFILWSIFFLQVFLAFFYCCIGSKRSNSCENMNESLFACV